MAIKFLGDSFVEGDDLALTAALQGLAFVPFVGEEIRQRRKEESTTLQCVAEKTPIRSVPGPEFSINKELSSAWSMGLPNS